MQPPMRGPHNNRFVDLLEHKRLLAYTIMIYDNINALFLGRESSRDSYHVSLVYIRMNSGSNDLDRQENEKKEIRLCQKCKMCSYM